MIKQLYELEKKRQKYERLSSSAESHDEAIERGWSQETAHNRSVIEAQRSEYQQLRDEILSLKKDCGREGSPLFDQLITWHLKTALTMYSEYLVSKKDQGVQIICLGNLIQELGAFVGPNGKIFTVNTFYLKNYYEYLEANKYESHT